MALIIAQVGMVESRLYYEPDTPAAFRVNKIFTTIYRDQNIPSSYKSVQIMAGVMLLMIPACSDSSTDPVSKAPVVEPPEFTGSVSGAVSGEISGQGVATYLLPQDTIDGVRPGYDLIANTRGATELLITFRIPAETKPGTYQLVAVDPMELGKRFEARIEGRRRQARLFGSNTEGTLTLDTFPADGHTLAGANIKGSFQLTTQEPQGEVFQSAGHLNFSHSMEGELLN